MNQISIWAYTTKEIKDLKSEFEEQFRIPLQRDYENVWEWIWNGPKAKQRLIISRQHNFQTGIHDKPLRITLSYDLGEIDKGNVVSLVQSILKTNLYIGDITNDGLADSDYKVMEEVKFE